MASLTNKKINETYEGLLKTKDNKEITNAVEITDGFGNGTGVTLDNSGNVTTNGDLHVLNNNITIEGGSDNPKLDFSASGYDNALVEAGNRTAMRVDMQDGLFYIGGDLISQGDQYSDKHAIEGEMGGGVSLFGEDQTLKLTTATPSDVVISAELDMSANKIKNTADPTDLQDVATKNYVDTNITAQDLDFTGDNATSGQVDLDSQTFDVVGTADQIVTEATNQQIKISLTDDVTIQNDLTITNDVIAQNNVEVVGNVEVQNNLEVVQNTILNTLEIQGETEMQDELTMSDNRIIDVADPLGNKDAANKGYVDSLVDAQDLDFTGDSGTGSVDLNTQSFLITGSGGIATTGGGNALVIDGSTLEGDIQQNSSDIAQNQADILANSTAISTNSTNIATNTTDIANNTTAIAGNTANISTNTSNIATNTSDIATNAGNIQTNANNIATNTSNINSNGADISQNTLDIATNTTNIANNTTAIANNTTSLSSLGASVATNTSNIATNTTDIADLQTDLGDKVNKAGDTMSGTLDMGTNYITNVADPVNNKDAANKEYVDQSIDSIVHYQTLTGMVNNLASQGSGGYDYMEWTSNVTGTDQIPAIRLPQGLKLVKVSWVWLGEVALSIGAGEQVEFSLRTLTAGTRSTISNYTSVGTLFTIDQNDNGTFAYGTETLTTPITLSAGDIIACIGQETGTVEPNNGELGITFLFEIT